MGAARIGFGIVIEIDMHKRAVAVRDPKELQLSVVRWILFNLHARNDRRAH